MAAGTAAGAINAALFGGNIGQATAFGAIGAAACYGVGSAIGGSDFFKANPMIKFLAEVADGGGEGNRQKLGYAMKIVS